jgi:uncharacterized protein (TIGR02996 family)
LRADDHALVEALLARQESTDMEQERIFLDAIRDDPDDDLHRLAWADWLDDNGQSGRADFVRAQVRLARLPEDDPDKGALEDQADDLLAEHEAAWVEGVSGCVLEWQWRRGCIERITVWADTLLSHGEELFRLAPIRAVRLLLESGDGGRLAALPLLGRLEELDLSRESRESALICSYQRDRPLQMLLASSHLKRLQVLRLRGHGIEGPLIQTLIDTGRMARLVELDLANNQPLGDRSARLLAGARAPALQAVDVQGTNVTAAGIRTLLRAQHLPGLTRLGFNAAMLFPHGLTAQTFEQEWASVPLSAQVTNLRFSSCALEPSAQECLLGWPGLARLRHLSLWGCRLDAAAAERLASCAALAGLHDLHLGNNQLRDTGARALAASPHLAGLASLQLAGNSIGGPGIRALVASPTLSRLDELDLSSNYVGPSGIDAFAEAKTSRRLRRLDLSDANLDSTCAGLLATAQSLARLRVLRLGNNPLGDEGIKALAGSPHLRRLRELYLDSCGLDSAGAQALVESPHLERVIRLGLRNTFITSRDRQMLEVRFGPGAEF